MINVGLLKMVMNPKKSSLSDCLFLALLPALLFILAIPTTLAIGISSVPFPKYYFFQPDMEIGMDMACYDYTDDCETYVEGELSQYTQLSSLVQSSANEKAFMFSMKLPADMQPPGEHLGYIGVTDIKKTASSGITVITKVRKVIRVMVLYGLPYAEVSFSAPNINENEIARFIFDVSNYGKQDLMLVYGNVDIYNSDGKKAGSAGSKSTGIRSTETTSIIVEWDSKGAVSGQYTAVGTLHYDGNEKIINQTFIIGIKDVQLVNHTEEFEEGKIGRMDINAKNAWNGPISGLYAVVNVNQTEFKTPTISLGNFQEGTLTGYLDATGLKKGSYDAEITLHFDGMQKTEKSSIIIYRPKGKGIYLPMQLGLNTTTILIIALIALVIFNIVMLLWMRKKGKGKSEGELS